MKTTSNRNSRECSKFKNCLSVFKTENMFDVFNSNTEDEIQRIICGDLFDKPVAKIRGQKKKCRRCGYKKKCHLKSSCKAKGKCCYACNKKNHFPKSKNCAMKSQKKAEEL